MFDAVEMMASVARPYNRTLKTPGGIELKCHGGRSRRFTRYRDRLSALSKGQSVVSRKRLYMDGWLAILSAVVTVPRVGATCT